MAGDESLESRASNLLSSRNFFDRLLDDLYRSGLVGEARNAVVLYLVAISALLTRPLNVIVKGASSAGKNFLISLVLRLLPESAIREITSSSKTAWNYGQNSFRHKVVYLQEHNDAAGSTHPVRLLISEGKLIRTVTTREGGIWVPKTFVAEGPISSISTTTRDRIEVDDETRHISLWMNESAAQTQEINQGYIAVRKPLIAEEIAVWRCAYGLIEKKAGTIITIPFWFTLVAKRVDADNLASRRYFPAFVEACKTVCLLRSFQNAPTDSIARTYELGFEDYAITAILFEKVFVESLHRSADDILATRNSVAEISKAKGGTGINAGELADYLNLSEDRAYRALRKASAAGAIRRANEPAKGNPKLFLPADSPRFLPDTGELLADIPEVPATVEFVHPLTGKPIQLRPAKTRKKAS